VEGNDPYRRVYLSDWHDDVQISVIVDSCGFTGPETDLLSAQDRKQGTPVTDLNWLRGLAGVNCRSFRPPQRRAALKGS